MSTRNDSAYNVTTLAALTGMPKTTAAAWIGCEGQGTPNPTNPLNMRYWGRSTQLLGPGANGINGVGFARYTSSLAGLTDSARLVATSGNYAGIRSAIATRDAVKVAQAIEASPWAAGHYGGGPGKAGCIVRGVNGGAAPSSGGTGGAASSGGTGGAASSGGTGGAASSGGIVSAVYLAHTAAAPSCKTITILAPANPVQTRIIPVPRDLIGSPCVACPDGWNFAAYDSGPFTFPGTQWVPLGDLKPGQANACVAPGVKAGDRPQADQAGDAASAAVGALTAWIPGFAANAAILVLVLLLGYKGLERILS